MSNAQSELSLKIDYVGSLTDLTTPVAVAIKNLIIMCDDDFVPPLSYRPNAVAAISEMSLHEKDYEPYYNVVAGQENLVVYNGDDIVAFLSFRHGEPHDHFAGVAQPGDVINYISTICVDNNFRRLGIAERFYDFMENISKDMPAEVYGNCVATRTWHTNNSHIKLLEKRGYKKTHTLSGDRNYENQKYDTVYYCKRIASAS